MTRTPYVDLSVMARMEAYRKDIHRPPYYVHKWWARRTGSVFRGMALDMLLPPEAGVMDNYYRRHDFSDIVCLDPFMGGGTSIGESLRLGCKVIGCDLNPVAWFLVSQATRALDGEALQAGFDQVRRAVEKPIGRMYETTCERCGEEANIQYTAWLKQAPCSACGELADLNRSRVLMQDFGTKGAGLVDCPRCAKPWWVKNVNARVQCPDCRYRFVPSDKPVASTHYKCGHCKHSEPILNVTRSLDHPPVHRMRCLSVWCDGCGRVYQRPTEADLAQYVRVERRVARRWDDMLIPSEAIPDGTNTDQMRRYGYRYWHQMFNARQLAGLDLLFQSIRSLDDDAVREVLTLHASSTLEFNSMFCGAKGLGTGAIRQVFAHHAFIPTKEPLEAHLWGVHKSSGGFASLYTTRLLRARAWAAEPVERRTAEGRVVKQVIHGESLAARPAANFQDLLDDRADVLLLNQSSESLYQVPDASVDLCLTDPPYADSVMYSELADYFYVWLRQALGADHPNFAAPVVDDAREAVHNPGRGRDGAFYTQLVASVFKEVNRVLKPNGRLAFSFHHAGEDAWQYIEDALVQSGFVVEHWWPVFAEMESGIPLRGKVNNNGHLDVVFVCGRVSEVVAAAQQDNIFVMEEKLRAKVPLVGADHRALVKAKDVQAHTFGRACTVPALQFVSLGVVRASAGEAPAAVAIGA